MFTIKNVLKRQITLDEYYQQFITPKLCEHFANSRIAKNYIISEEYKKDENLNTIPMAFWDELVVDLPIHKLGFNLCVVEERDILPIWQKTIETMESFGYGGFSLLAGVYIMKEIAKMTIA